FSVFRTGKPFYHPITNELIGETEDLVGRVEVNEGVPRDGLYPCAIIKGNVSAGDKVRITSSKVRLTFFQERKSNWSLSEAFHSSLKDTGRFEILETYSPAFDPEELSRLSREINAEAVLLLSTPVKDGKEFLNVKLYWAEDAKTITEIEDAAGPAAVMPPPAEEFISSSFEGKEPWGSFKLPAGQLFAMGDVDNNGAPELVVSDGSNISVYSFRDELQELWSIKGNSNEKHLSVDVLDLNNNGAAEIFVTSLVGSGGTDTGDGKMRSFVMEYSPSAGYKKINSNISFFLRVIGKTLLMQKFGTRNAFDGPVYEGEWKNGDLRPAKALDLPSGANIYGFTFVDWRNNGQQQIMTFDDDGHLILYDGRKQPVWKSDRTYGKFNLSFSRTTFSIANPVVTWSVRGRLIAAGTGRGQEVFVVHKIPISTTAPGLGIKEVEVYSLWWDGNVMDEKLVLGEISGAVTDYWTDGKKLFLMGRIDLFSFIKNASGGELSRGNLLYYYDLGER
ncbi:MAG: VCBS repeat-containing protein, partial [Nitrospiraceae bacterium]